MERTPQEIESFFWEQLNPLFDRFRQMNIVEAMNECGLDTQAQQRKVSTFFNSCAIQWGINPARHNLFSNHSAIGVVDDWRYLTAHVTASGAPLEISQTHNRAAIEVLRTRHGLPLYALNSADVLEDFFDA